MIDSIFGYPRERIIAVARDMRQYWPLSEVAFVLGVSRNAIRLWIDDSVAAEYRKYSQSPARKAYQSKYAQTQACKASRRKYEQTPARKAKRRDYQREYDQTPARKAAKALRIRLHAAIKGQYKSGSAVRDLGCSIEEFVAYFDAHFAPGMSWDNHGEWHIDHKRPLASFDLTDREQVKIALNWRNLQPLWGPDNLSKGAKV